jgi:hypothetical protein
MDGTSWGAWVLGIGLLWTTPVMAETPEQQAIINRALVQTGRHLPGQVTENFMDRYYQAQDWEKLPSQVGRQGIDGLYVRRDGNGQVTRVLVSEAKFGGSPLGQTQCGMQMSQGWVLCGVDSLIGDLDKRQQQGTLNEADARRLQKDVQAVRRLVEQGAYRSRLFHAIVEDGALRITIQDLRETLTGGLEQRTPDGRARIEADVQAIKEPRQISLRTPPTDLGERKIYDAYFADVEQELKNKGMAAHTARQTVQELQAGFQAEKVQSNREQTQVLSQRLIGHLETQVKEARSLPAQWTAKMQLAQARWEQQVPRELRGVVNGRSMVGTLAVAGKLGWQSYDNPEAFGAALQTVAKDEALSRSSAVVANALISVTEKRLTVMVPAVRAGGQLAIAAFMFEEAGHAWAMMSGEMSMRDFLYESAKSTLRAGATGAMMAGAVLLGANPLGWTVLAINMAGGLLMDMAIAAAEAEPTGSAAVATTVQVPPKKPVYISIDDILGHLPVQVRQRMTLLNPEEVQRVTLLDFDGLKRTTLLNSEESDRETLLDPGTMKRKTVLE